MPIKKTIKKTGSGKAGYEFKTPQGAKDLAEKLGRVILDPIGGEGHNHGFTTEAGANVTVSSFGRAVFGFDPEARRRDMSEAVAEGLAMRAEMLWPSEWSVEVMENLGFHVQIFRGSIHIDARRDNRSGLKRYTAQIGHSAHHAAGYSAREALEELVSCARKSLFEEVRRAHAKLSELAL